MNLFRHEGWFIHLFDEKNHFLCLYEQSGIPLDPAGVRVSRMEESLHILKGLFAP